MLTSTIVLIISCVCVSVRATRAGACRKTACTMFHRVQCMFGEVVGHYHTPSKEHMAHTHTLLWSSFQVCGGYLCIFQCRCIFFFLLEGRRTSGWSSAPFTFYLSSWRRSCRERTSVMNRAPAGSCDPTRRGRTPLGRRNHRPRGPNHPPLSPHLQGDPNR